MIQACLCTRHRAPTQYHAPISNAVSDHEGLAPREREGLACWATTSADGSAGGGRNADAGRSGDDESDARLWRV